MQTAIPKEPASFERLLSLLYVSPSRKKGYLSTYLRQASPTPNSTPSGEMPGFALSFVEYKKVSEMQAYALIVN